MMERRRALMMGAKKSRLPKEFQEVKFLESTGGQYIDTGVFGQDGLKVEATTSIVRFLSNDTLIGAIDSKNAHRIYAMLNYSGRLAMAINETYFADGEPPINKKMNLVYIFRNKNSKIFLNGNQVLSEQEENIYTSDRTLYIFASHWAKNVGGYACIRLYEISTDINALKIRKYVPCYSKSDNKPGLYDLCGSICPLTNSPFYINAGTGEFLVGPDVN